MNLFGHVTVRYVRGLPHITVPLPSRNERCQFTLRPVTHSVGNFLDMLKDEDRGIDRAAVLNRDGVRIASSCSIETLMEDDFCHGDVENKAKIRNMKSCVRFTLTFPPIPVATTAERFGGFAEWHCFATAHDKGPSHGLGDHQVAVIDQPVCVLLADAAM
ncbi:conserved hypothetical protein [Culex quinquefasciatus]|uniref:Uncharacterized protein n=1 Tax=Culex quinquefasciatus TaxID=7176 RepID=B0WXJ7_CULQU|nr:conserved hypothetical protein [Culex quinquefasciatus]|eukprot:XP_001862119.1 conserved hypothetical protein [Culex quinquefasciatus]